jgi:signal transduction histidine kinase
VETQGKILVIDDEIGICKGCRRVLEPEGFQVDTACTIKEGLNKILNGDYDLVLLDVMMPDGRGIDLLGPINESDPEIVIIIITGYATVELAVNAIRQGAYDFISKPFTSDLLLITVSQGIEKRRLALEAKRLQDIERKASRLAYEKEEMERLDRFKSEFMLTVAHELRSPIGGALSLLRTLLRGLAGELSEQQNEILKRIEIRLNNLLELVNDLLSLAATKSVEPDQPLESVPLQKCIHQILERFSVEANAKHQSLSFESPDELIFVRATEDGLATVFGNLIGNAIKYTPEGGDIQVRVVPSNGEAQISVTDTGIGIPKEDLPRLGEEFFRAKNARQSDIGGTGLGLSIVKQLVERFGGLIAISSTPGEGTMISVKLNLAGVDEGYS